MKSPILEDHLTTLRLPTMRDSYARIERATAEKIQYLTSLAHLEVENRHQNGINNRLAAARFPTIKTFDTYDFNAQTDLPKLKLLEHAEAPFVENARNIVLYGPPGTGKTHCLIALGVAACVHGYRTRFFTAASLLTMLLDTKRDGSLSKAMRALERYDLLLIDELGYIPFEREATDLLFQVISERYESKSIAITTNLAFEEWNQVFPTAMAATAIIDRLVHHGSVFEFKGQSHRLKTRSGNTQKPAKN
jgi:DNA replication protein DnaC